jgi:hypothetical protein
MNSKITPLVIFVPHHDNPSGDDICFQIFEDGESYFVEKFKDGKEEIPLCSYSYAHLSSAILSCGHMMQLYPEIKYVTRITYLME